MPNCWEGFSSIVEGFSHVWQQFEIEIESYSVFNLTNWWLG
jgi:hypothetical protein